MDVHRAKSGRSPNPLFAEEQRTKASLPEGGFRKLLPTEKHHQRKILGGVSIFSAKNAEASDSRFVLQYINYNAQRLKRASDDGEQVEYRVKILLFLTDIIDERAYGVCDTAAE